MLTHPSPYFEYRELADAVGRRTDIGTLGHWQFVCDVAGRVTSLNCVTGGRTVAIHGESGHLASYLADNGLWAFTITTTTEQTTDGGYDALDEMLDALAAQLLNREVSPKPRTVSKTHSEAYIAYLNAFSIEYREAIDFLNEHFAGRLSWQIMQAGEMTINIGSDSGDKKIWIGGVNRPLADRRSFNGRWSVNFCDWATGGNDSLFAVSGVPSLPELAAQIETGLHTLGWPQAHTAQAAA